MKQNGYVCRYCSYDIIESYNMMYSVVYPGAVCMPQKLLNNNKISMNESYSDKVC